MTEPAPSEGPKRTPRRWRPALAVAVAVAAIATVTAFVALRADAPMDTAASSTTTAWPTAPGATPPVDYEGRVDVDLPIYGGPDAWFHDPTIVRDGDTYRIFTTDPGIPSYESTDLVHWTSTGTVFDDAVPAWMEPTSAWAGKEVELSDEIGAPDVSFFDGEWHLYYHVLADDPANPLLGALYGVAGWATNPVLDPDDPRYEWTDHGLLMASSPANLTTTRVIDLDVSFDADGNPWLAWGGAVWGIYVQRLDPATGTFLAGSTPKQIARRNPPLAGIEAASITYRSGWYYLFTSWGVCCAGASTNYNVRVVRSRAIDGPYLDKLGNVALSEGGTSVLDRAGDAFGPGGQDLLVDDGRWWMVHHVYDRADGYRAKPAIRPIEWTADGWPYVPGADLSQAPPATTTTRPG